MLVAGGKSRGLFVFYFVDFEANDMLPAAAFLEPF
jgi:hypothetical protein